MYDSIEIQKHVSVFESTLTIQQNTLSVFNIIIQGPQSTVSLIRYPFDLLEFHQKIRLHYPRVKITFPSLSNPSKKRKNKDMKRRSFRDLIPLFSRKKTNATKVEKYIERCFQHPVIRISSILRDFTSVQRDEDSILTNQHTSTTLTPSVTAAAADKRPTTSNMSLEDLTLLKVLGKGCMGKVLLVRHNTSQQLYALKSIKKKWIMQQKEVVHTRTERDILVQLRNQPFIALLHHVFQTPSALFLILQYYAGGDIATQLSIMTTFSEEKTRFYAAEIVQGLEILHQHGIIYRDLKPENVLIGHDGHIILTDFGLSKQFTMNELNQGEDAPTTKTFCGTAEYLAPEILLGEPYTFVVDFWSLGTLLYEMLAGTTPFWADAHMDMYKRVLDDTLEFPSHFDPVTVDFLTGLLEKDPYERLGWGEHGIRDIKSHAYFKSMDWDKVKQRQLIPPFIPKLKSETDASNFDDVFTSLPILISQSSAIDEGGEEDEEDLFKGFSFDAAMTTPPMPIHQNKRLRKRPSEAISLTSSSNHHHRVTQVTGRANKKRQTTNNNTALFNEDDDDEEECILVFQQQNQPVTLPPSPYERPHCPIPGQRPHSYIITRQSSASTLNNSISSYLTVSNNQDASF